MESWQFLLIGSFAAIGAALSLGTLAALWRYRRTGAFPGQEQTTEVGRGQLVGLWLRVVVGAAVAVAGTAALANVGLLTG